MNTLRNIASSTNLRVTRSNAPRELTATDITKGFVGITAYLATHYPNRKFTVICSGGACSVLYLRNRKKTHDVDIFSSDEETLRIVLEAGRAVYQKQGAGWPADWINAEMVAYVLNCEGCEHLVANSEKQHVILYDSKHFRVYAADWRYQVVGKIQRAYDKVHDNGNSDVDKDISDMVHILHTMTGPRSILLRRSDMLKWYYYGYRMGIREAEFANGEYAKAYGRPAIANT